MADEQDNSQKTEEPTQKRLDDARKKGDVVKSQDVPAWFLLMAAAAIVAGGRPRHARHRGPAGAYHGPPAGLPADGRRRNERDACAAAGAAAAAWRDLQCADGRLRVLGHIIQVRPLWTFEKIKPDLNKLSPMKGLGRMFGPQGWMNLVEGCPEDRRGRHRDDVCGLAPGVGDRRRRRARSQRFAGAGAVAGRPDIYRCPDRHRTDRRVRLHLAADELHEPHEDVPARHPRRGQAGRGRSAHSRKAAHDPHGAVEEADAGQRPEGHGRDQQPDSLLGRPALRAGHRCSARLSRQRAWTTSPCASARWRGKPACR